MRNMLGRVIASISVISTALLFILLRMTAPATIGPLGILFVFILMYLSVLGVVTFAILMINRVVIRTSSYPKNGPNDQPMTTRRAYYFASVIALAPVIIVGMQSVGEIGVYDLLLVILFVVIGCIYIAKRTN